LTFRYEASEKNVDGSLGNGRRGIKPGNIRKTRKSLRLTTENVKKGYYSSDMNNNGTVGKKNLKSFLQFKNSVWLGQKS
jgi:hypothetical protein